MCSHAYIARRINFALKSQLGLIVSSNITEILCIGTGYRYIWCKGNFQKEIRSPAKNNPITGKKKSGHRPKKSPMTGQKKSGCRTFLAGRYNRKMPDLIMCF